MAHHILNRENQLQKSKKELLEELGIGDNYHEMDEWSYLIGKNLLGGEKYLIMEFDGEIVVRTYYRVIYPFRTILF